VQSPINSNGIEKSIPTSTALLQQCRSPHLIIRAKQPWSSVCSASPNSRTHRNTSRTNSNTGYSVHTRQRLCLELLLINFRYTSPPQVPLVRSQRLQHRQSIQHAYHFPNQLLHTICPTPTTTNPSHVLLPNYLTYNHHRLAQFTPSIYPHTEPAQKPPSETEHTKRRHPTNPSPAPLPCLNYSADESSSARDGLEAYHPSFVCIVIRDGYVRPWAWNFDPKLRDSGSG